MSDESIKLAVLEQKLLDFSNIVHKLDDAIQKLSEVNTNITRMLAVHDERIEQCNKSDSILIKMIDEIKRENIDDHQQVIKRIESIEEKVLEINKIKWMTVGCGVLLTILAASLSSLASGWWTPSEMQQHNRMRMESKY
jgi:hypothetical protein